MKICEEKKEEKKEDVYVHPEFVAGNIYRNKASGAIYIGIKLCSTHKEILGSISEGIAWNSYEPFGKDLHDYNQWEDVTDQYCLQKVK